ncbi:MAG: hypothetical protein ACLRRB_01600 [Ruminococcus sp.]
MDAVLSNMQRSHIRGVEVMVEIDSAPKRKNSSRSNGRGTGGKGGYNKGGRSRSYDNSASSSQRRPSRRASGSHDKSVRKEQKRGNKKRSIPSSGDAFPLCFKVIACYRQCYHFILYR